MSDSTNSRIRIAALLGSVRPGNYTSMALSVAADEVRNHQEIGLDLVDPATLELPFPGLGGNGDAGKLRQTVSEATGVILATPEYHGSFSSIMKLMIENLGFPSVLAGKPVALLGVAAGQIGAIKSLEALSSVCAHVGAIVLPGPVSVARVRDVFDAEGRCRDQAMEKRIRSVATNLIEYIRGSICPRIALEALVRGGS